MAKKGSKVSLKPKVFRCYNLENDREEKWLSVDTDKLGSKVQKMKETMLKKVIGQEKAIDKATEGLTRMEANMEDPEKGCPKGVFLFLGPTGVGKTRTAKAIAEVYVGAFGALTRVDMSEYSQPHTVARLIGAPDGYVKCEDDPLLCQTKLDEPYLEANFPEFKELNGTFKKLAAELKEEEEYLSDEEWEKKKAEIRKVLKQVREYRKRISETEIRSVLLLDEVEKAHTEVIKVLLQVFDEGRLTTNKGTTSFKNTIVFMTSNINAEETADISTGKGVLGFATELSQEEKTAKIEKSAEEKLSKIFPPELIGRIRGNGGIVTFNPLSEEKKGQIVDLQMENFGQGALEHRYPGEDRVVVQYYPKELIPLILSQVDPRYGAREITRILEANVFNPFRQAVNSGEIEARDVVHVAVQEGKVKLFKSKRLSE